MQHFVGENLVKTRGQIRLPTSRVFDVEAKKKSWNCKNPSFHSTRKNNG